MLSTMKLAYEDQTENIRCKQNPRISLELAGQIFKKLGFKRWGAGCQGRGAAMSK